MPLAIQCQTQKGPVCYCSRTHGTDGPKISASGYNIPAGQNYGHLGQKMPLCRRQRPCLPILRQYFLRNIFHVFNPNTTDNSVDHHPNVVSCPGAGLPVTCNIQLHNDSGLLPNQSNTPTGRDYILQTRLPTKKDKRFPVWKQGTGIPPIFTYFSSRASTNPSNIRQLALPDRQTSRNTLRCAGKIIQLVRISQGSKT